jgi:hypothetical protein
VVASVLAEREGLVAGACYHIGSLHAAAGDVATARDFLGRCLQLNPEHQWARAALRELDEEMPE